VLFGGAVALLPIYAKDILQVGPSGLGWLRAAPAFGAFTMAITQAHLPPMKKAGKALLWSVVGFGIVTIVFGLSRSFWLSLLMLALSGALDNISVVIRHTLVQIRTPDHLRGRVSAVNSVFISISNELGGFESGFVAALFGPIFSVVSGGVGTIFVVLIVTLIFPEIRRLTSLQDV
jgi:MFS family permease